MTGAATADPVFVEYCGQGEFGGLVSIDYTGFAPSVLATAPVWAGYNKQVVGGRMTHSFGLDLFKAAGTGEHDVDMPRSVLNSEVSDALNALYNATNGGQVSSNAGAVAFQAVLWELTTDFRGPTSTIDMHAGSLVFRSGVDESLFDFYKSAALGSNRNLQDSNLRVLSRDGLQRQAIAMESLSIPLPSGAALGVAGLGLVARRRVRA